jgi:hypothetical protein
MKPIIGIIIDKTGGPWPRIDADGNTVSVTQIDFDAHPTYAGIAGDLIAGQHMVRIPAFFYRAGTVLAGEHAGKKALWISPEPAEGFALHPAFRHHGADLAQFWVGKYQGTPDNDKLGSQPGLKPLARIDFPAMQQAAAARNGDSATGFMLWSIYQLGALQTLALIECGTPDIKSVLGDGYVNGDGVREVDCAEQVVWRGIIGLWGNVWQMVDGLQTNSDREYRIWDADGNQTYVETDVEAPGDGWFRRRSTERDKGFDLGAVFLPTSTRDDSDEAPYGNYFWSYPNAVAYHGGYWGTGANAGLFYLYVSNAASNSNTSFGGRLAKV